MEIRAKVDLTGKPVASLIPVEPIFVFPAKSEKLKKLLAKCFVELASFFAPNIFTPKEPKEPFAQALEYLFQQEYGVEERTDWNQMVEEVNALVARLSHKPVRLKCMFSLHPGSILNAYREGDLGFDEAVHALKQLTK